MRLRRVVQCPHCCGRGFLPRWEAWAWYVVFVYLILQSVDLLVRWVG